MRIAQVRGRVTLNRAHPLMEGARYCLAIPLKADQLTTDTTIDDGEWLVVYDDLGANNGTIIMVSEGAEAAQPFFPELKPIDAYNAGIIDRVDLAKS